MTSHDLIIKYIASIKNNQCEDDKDEKLRKLMQYVEEFQKNKKSDYDMKIIDMLIQAAECVLNEKTSSHDDSPPTKQSDEETCHETYAADETEQHAWVIEEVPHLTFDDIIGAEDAIQVIKEAIILPLLYPSLFERAQAIPWRGALLYGPPGTGKSLLARTAASEANVAFFNASCADLTSKFVGGSEKLVRSLFQRAREIAPALIFFDEIDSIAGARESEKSTADQRLTNQLLLEIDRNSACDRPIFTLAATNLPWAIDSAVMRRLSKKIYIPLPTTDKRQKMLQKMMPKSANLSSEQFKLLADRCVSFSGSDLQSFCNDLKMEPLRQLMTATRFEIQMDENEEFCMQAHPKLENSVWCERDQIIDLNGVIQHHGEDVVCIPNISFEKIMTILEEFKKHVKTQNIHKYEQFNCF